MITYKKVKTTVVKPISITCDKCGKIYEVEGNELEIQEFLHINFTGGYMSVFGDMNTVQADICQHCLRTMIESFMRVNSSDYRDNSVCVIE